MQFIFSLDITHILFIVKWLRLIFFLKSIKDIVYPSNCIYDNTFYFSRHPDMHSFYEMLSSDSSVRLHPGTIPEQTRLVIIITIIIIIVNVLLLLFSAIFSFFFLSPITSHSRIINEVQMHFWHRALQTRKLIQQMSKNCHSVTQSEERQRCLITLETEKKKAKEWTFHQIA